MLDAGDAEELSGLVEVLDRVTEIDRKQETHEERVRQARRDRTISTWREVVQPSIPLCAGLSLIIFDPTLILSAAFVMALSFGGRSTAKSLLAQLRRRKGDTNDEG